MFRCSVIKGGFQVRSAIILDQKSYSCSPRSYDYCLCLYAICNLTASACAGQMRLVAERRPPHLGQECVRTCAVSRYCSWTICEAEVRTQIATRVRGLCGSNELKTHYVSSSLRCALYHIPLWRLCSRFPGAQARITGISLASSAHLTLA